MVDRFFGHDWRTVFRVEDWQRNPPDPLPGDHPIAPVAEHVVEADLPPFWLVFHFVNCRENFIAHLVNGNKPLVSRPENDWLLSPPVKWVGVLKRFLQQERIIFRQLGQGNIIRVLVEDPFKALARFGRQLPLVVDWGKDR